MSSIAFMSRGCLAIACVLAAACSSSGSSGAAGDGGSDAASTAVNSITLAHPTFVVDSSNIAQITALSSDYSSFSVPVGPATSALTAVGNTVLFAITDKTPYGKALTITSTSTSGGVITVQATAATLTQVFSSANLAMDWPLGASSKVDTSRTTLPAGVVVKSENPERSPLDYGTKARKDGFYIGLNNYELVNQNSDGFSGKVVVDANLFLSANPKMNLRLDLSGLHELSVGATFEEAINAALDAEGHIDWNDEIELAKIYFAPITIVVADIPIVFNPYVSMTAGGSFTANASLHASASEQFTLDARFGWIDGGFDGTFSPTLTTQSQPPYFDQANAKLKFQVGAKAGIELYASPGVSVGADGFIALSADKSASPCFDLSGGIEAKTSEDVSLLGFKIAQGSQNLPIPGGTVDLLSGGCTSSSGGVAETLDAPGTLWGYTEEQADSLVAPVRASRTADGGILIGRNRNRSSYIARLDASGKVVWVKTQEGTSALGAALMDPVDLQERPDNSIAVLYGGPYPDQLLVLTDANAAPTAVEKYAFASGYSVNFSRFVQTSDWGFVVVGKGSLLGDAAVIDYTAVMRLDASGQVVWAKQIVGSDSGAHVYPASVVLSPSDSSLVVSGYETGAGGDSASRLWVAKLDLDGTVVWSKAYQEVINDITDHTAGALAMTPDGQLLVGGSYQYVSSSDFFEAPYAMKLDGSGNVVWVQGTNTSAWVNGVTATSEGDLVLSGQNPSGYAQTVRNLWRARFSGTNGVQQWSMVYDVAPSLGGFYKTFPLTNGNLATLGFRADSNSLSELLLLTTVSAGTSTLPADAKMTSSNSSGNVVALSATPQPIALSVTDLSVQPTALPLQSSSGATVPVFVDISGIKQTVY